MELGIGNVHVWVERFTLGGWPRRGFERLGCATTGGYGGRARLSIPLVPASRQTSQAMSGPLDLSAAESGRRESVEAPASEPARALAQRLGRRTPCRSHRAETLVLFLRTTSSGTVQLTFQRTGLFGTRAKRSFGDLRSQTGVWDRGRKGPDTKSRRREGEEGLSPSRLRVRNIGEVAQTSLWMSG